VTEYKPGDLVTIAGKGEVLLSKEFPSMRPGRTSVWLCQTHGNYNAGYWVEEKDIVRKATKEDILARHAQAVVRGVECRDDFCWCRKYHE
jgi:hypothetical protein